MMGETVYKEPLGGLLTLHILLCFLLVGFVTLPVALVRWSRRRLIVSDQALTLQRGARSRTIPINRIDNINVQRPGGRAGTLLISAGGVPTAVKVARAEQAHEDIQQRILRFQERRRSPYAKDSGRLSQAQQTYPQYTDQQHLLQMPLLEEQPPLQQPSKPQEPYPQSPSPQSQDDPPPLV